jgi:hypothetical protein
MAVQDVSHLASKVRAFAKEAEQIAERFESENVTVRVGDVEILVPDGLHRATVKVNGTVVEKITKLVLTLDVHALPTLHIERVVT